jgi:hypothetical protein
MRTCVCILTGNRERTDEHEYRQRCQLRKAEECDLKVGLQLQSSRAAVTDFLNVWILTSCTIGQTIAVVRPGRIGMVYTLVPVHEDHLWFWVLFDQQRQLYSCRCKLDISPLSARAETNSQINVDRQEHPFSLCPPVVPFTAQTYD